MAEVPAYQLLRGDCVHLLRRLPDASVDAIVTDPPYGIELRLQWTRQAKAILGDGRAEARRLWTRVLPQLARVARPNTAHLVFGTWKSPWMLDLLAEHFTVKGCVCWDKRWGGLGWWLRPSWELAFLVHNGRPPLPAKADIDVWPIRRIGRPRHPCEKPVELLRRAIRLVRPPGVDRPLILDPFAGIASTGVAAFAEGCRFLGVERDPRHARLGRQRLAQAAAECDRPGRL